MDESTYYWNLYNTCAITTKNKANARDIKDVTKAFGRTG